MARALQGLTLDESATRCAARCQPAPPCDYDALPRPLDEKKLLVNKSGLVQYVADGTEIGHVGGLEYLKNGCRSAGSSSWCATVSLPTSFKRHPGGVEYPGGKSLSVKAIASCFPSRSTGST
jgi:hypothetical protein